VAVVWRNKEEENMTTGEGLVLRGGKGKNSPPREFYRAAE